MAFASARNPRSSRTKSSTSKSVHRGSVSLRLRGYYVANENLNFVGGIENLFDRNYLEHLSLRIPKDDGLGIPATRVLAPGISPYFGLEWTF